MNNATNNITIIGLRCSGKSYILNKLNSKIYNYISFDNVLDEELKRFGGLTTAIRSGKAHQTLNQFAPAKIYELLSSKNNLILELSAQAIISSFKKTNKINLNTIITYSTPIAIFPTCDADQAINLLFQREIIRQSNKSINHIQSEYIKFSKVCYENNFDIKYSDESLSWLETVK
ncbi:MAG: hypothetical protein ACP5N2_03625 [Candidatus Nanoarchaeia archaeon]